MNTPSFKDMWNEADYVDASIGGCDSIPEWEYNDYIQACLWNQFQEANNHE